MPEYRLTWEIDIEADSPREAAQKALDIQRRDGSMATVFEVFDENGEMTKVDLLEEPDEWESAPEQPEAAIDSARIAVNAVQRPDPADDCNCGKGGPLGEHHAVTCPDHTPF